MLSENLERKTFDELMQIAADHRWINVLRLNNGECKIHFTDNLTDEGITYITDSLTISQIAALYSNCKA